MEAGERWSEVGAGGPQISRAMLSRLLSWCWKRPCREGVASGKPQGGVSSPMKFLGLTDLTQLAKTIAFRTGKQVMILNCADGLQLQEP